MNLNRYLGINSKLWLFLLILLSGTTAALAQAVEYNQGTVSPKNFYAEMPYESVNGKVIITMVLGGKPRRFLIDTGSLCAITESLQNEMNFPILASSKVRDINEQSNTLTYVKLDKFSFANAEFNQVPAVVFPVNILSGCFKIDGILGSNLFRHGLLQFDSKKKVIRFTGERSKLNLSNKSSHKLRLDEQSGPHIQVRLPNGVMDEALFDSGSEDLYALALQVYDANKSNAGFEVFGESFGANVIGFFGPGMNSEVKRLRFSDFSIAGISIDNVMTETHPNERSRLGSEILDYGILTLDYLNSSYNFEPNEKKPRYTTSYWSIHPTLGEGKIVIGMVWDKSLLNKVELGDQILAVGARSLETFDICDLILNPILEGKSKAEIKVKRKNGDVVSVPIEKKKY